jgi:acyl carrier protein
VRPPSDATKAKISRSGAQQRVGNNIMSKAKDLNEMQEWLIKRISTSLRVKNGMDPDAPFSKYGLQSIDAVILAMEIEEEVGVELPPTLLWEYNTVNECASYLVKIGSDIAA